MPHKYPQRVRGSANANNGLNPEQQLWAAVVTQAILDATDPTVANTGGNSRHPKWLERKYARKWLLEPTKDSAAICDAAGVHWQALQDWAKRAEADGWPADLAGPIGAHREGYWRRTQRKKEACNAA